MRLIRVPKGASYIDNRFECFNLILRGEGCQAPDGWIESVNGSDNPLSHRMPSNTRKLYLSHTFYLK